MSKMSYMSEFLKTAIPFVEDMGFKYVKTKRTAIYKAGKNTYEINFLPYQNDFIHFAYRVCNVSFQSIFEELTNTPIISIIELETSMAFWSYPDSKFCGKYYFSDAYLIEGTKEDYFDVPKAIYEFEKLVSKHTMPWFDRYKNIHNIIATFRKTSNKYDTKNNIDITPDSSLFHVGGIFQMFFCDLVLTKLLNEKSYSSTDLYDVFYKRSYLDYWSRIDSDTGKSLMEDERTKADFAILPEIIKRIDNVSNEQWELYRKATGIGQ